MTGFFVAFWLEEANKMLVGNIPFSSDGNKNKARYEYDFVWDENSFSKLKKFKIRAIIYSIKDPVDLGFLKQLKEIQPKALLIGLVD